MPSIIPNPTNILRGTTKHSKKLSPCFVMPGSFYWDECLTSDEFAYNTSVNLSLGETPFFLNHSRNPALPVAMAHKVLNLAVEDFTQHLQNRILEVRDHILRCQETRARHLEQGMRPSQLKVGDLVLLSKKIRTSSCQARNSCLSGWDPSKCWKSEEPTLSEWRSPLVLPCFKHGEFEALSPLPSQAGARSQGPTSGAGGW